MKARRRAAPSTIVFVQDSLGDVFHYSANDPELEDVAIQGCREWLAWIRRQPPSARRRPNGRAKIIVQRGVA